MSWRISLLLIGLSWATFGSAGAQEPGWSSDVFSQQYRSLNILDRPYRPFHVYGNTVRRRHYRGRPSPRTRDVPNAPRVLARRR